MGKLVLSAMLLLLFSCHAGRKEHATVPPELRILNYDTLLKKTADGWLYRGNPFSGYMIQAEKDGRTVYELPITDGKENGIAKGKYNTGEKLMERIFIDGKREGVFKQWWPNGQIRYLLTYKNDVYDGVQYVFFPDGKKQQVSNYRMGELEGLQSIWNKEDQLISNYTYRDNKLYGIITAKNCMPNGH
jgi:antitoxin component YwqK of YwqJK toxin-antitoxin module